MLSGATMFSKVERARREARSLLAAVGETDQRLLMPPDEYTHKVKFPVSHESSLDELREAVRLALEKADGLSLYHHMPVCPYRCSYCHYPIVVQPGQEWRWVRLALEESEHFVDMFPPARILEVRSLYVGGGTPALLTFDQASALIKHYQRYFHVSPQCEVSFEGTPDTLPSSRIDDLRRAGVTRLSIGIQTLDDVLLANMHRKHTGQDALRVVSNAIKAGFEGVNADLIYGLPTQTPARFREDLEQLIELGPASITIYRLRLHRPDELPTEMYRSFLVDQSQFPSAEDTLTMHILGRDMLADAGYQEGPTGWFHRPEKKIQVYEDRWARQVPLAAFGWWTYSYSELYEYYAHHDRRLYEEAVHRGELPIAKASVYSPDERVRRFFSFRLKAALGVSDADMDARFERTLWTSIIAPTKERLLRAGLIVANANGISLTPSGCVLIEEVLERGMS